MKNINMTINSNAIQNIAPAPLPFPVIPEYSVSFSIRFDNENEAVAFAKFILNDIETFKNGDR